MRSGKTARLLDAIAAAHDAEAAKLAGKGAAFQRDLARQARARADRIDGGERKPLTGATRREREAIRRQLRTGCARCGQPFNDPGLGRGYGAAWQSADGAIHYPACATPEEIAEVARRFEALRKARGATR